MSLSTAQQAILNSVVIRTVSEFAEHSKNTKILSRNSDNQPVCIVCPATRHNLHILDIALDYVDWPQFKGQDAEVDAFLRAALNTETRYSGELDNRPTALETRKNIVTNVMGYGPWTDLDEYYWGLYDGR
jgi:hypothetical protein